MEMPTPGPAQRVLTRLVGRWEGTETMHPSPWDAVGSWADGRHTLQAALLGFAVVGDYVQRQNNHVTFRGHGVWRYDNGTGSFECHWFDSFGASPDVFRGVFEDEALVLTCQGAMGHFRLTWDLSRSDRIVTTTEHSPAGQTWVRFFDGVYQRCD